MNTSRVMRLSLLAAAAAAFSSTVDAKPARQGSREAEAPSIVQTKFAQDYSPGTIVISLSQKRLYLVTGGGAALQYRVAVGKAGKSWTGTAYVRGKFVRPDWMPPAVVKRDNPKLPDLIPGGSPGNPMGERAITLNLDEIAIHGTSASMRRSIGSAASYGCIRMLNEDVVDLYDRISVGTPVVAIR